jgi:cytochrome c oxidase cbb3-type subunit III
MLRTAYDTPHIGAEEPTQSFISMSCDHAKCPTRSFRFFALLRASGIVLALVVLPSTAGSQAAVLRNPASRVASTKGKTLFESSCAVCHGLDGGGGEHAPSIGRSSAAKSLTDSDLGRILHDVIPGTGMPAFNTLGDLKIRSILSYLRFLQVKTEAQTDTGNPNQGKELFFGNGQCADCHAMGGKGRFLSTDLSDFAYNHNPSEIRIAIVSPQEQEGVPHTSVSVTTSSGQRFFGLIRNENNSSLQMQDADGQFYLFMKSDLGSIERSPAPSMPVDYKQKLSSTEIEDLVSYIVHQSSFRKLQARNRLTIRKKIEIRCLSVGLKGGAFTCSTQC